MPEGNELHRWAEMHQKAFGGKKVRADSPQGRFEDAGLLDGRVLVSAMAVGKHLGYDFGKIEGERRILHVHMGLYGDFTEGTGATPEPKGALRLRIWTKQDWLELRGPTDCSVYTQEKWDALLARLGPDPLNEDPAAKMVERIRARKTDVGALLMDQSVLAGVGNIYRAELLFRARVSPFRAGNAMEAKELTAIYKDAGVLMRHGMVDRRIVTTKAKDRPHAKGEALDEEAHYVYRRQGKPCFVCGTKVLTKPMAGRNLFWCPTCQAE
jgi:endonuclease-8